MYRQRETVVKGGQARARKGADVDSSYIPRGKYLSRITRIIVFGFLAYACLSIAISSYVHGHRTGYTPFSQISTTADPHPNPMPFVIVGVFFALLTLLQTRKTIRVRKRRQEASNQYRQGRFAPGAPQYGSTPQPAAWPASTQVVYPQTGSTMPPTAAQNAAYNANGAAAQNAARNMHGNAQ